MDAHINIKFACICERLDKWIDNQIMQNPQISLEELAELCKRSSKTIKCTKFVQMTSVISYVGSHIGSSTHWKTEKYIQSVDKDWTNECPR